MHHKDYSQLASFPGLLSWQKWRREGLGMRLCSYLPQQSVISSERVVDLVDCCSQSLHETSSLLAQ